MADNFTEGRKKSDVERDEVLEKIQRLSSKGASEDGAFFEKFLCDYCHSGSYLSQTKERFHELCKLHSQWTDTFSRQDFIGAEEKCMVLLRNFSALYAASYAFAGTVDETFRYLIPLLNHCDPSNKEKFCSGFPIKIRTDKDNFIALQLPLPQRKKLYTKQGHKNSHSSTMRQALRFSLLEQDLPLKHEEISINFLFNYAPDDIVSDHDNLAVSGWIDDISWALGIDDNGISCATHFWSAKNSSLEQGTYILVTRQNCAPMKKDELFNFFTSSLTF